MEFITMSSPNLEIGFPKKISVEHLHFDLKNPRYSEDHGTLIKTDSDIISFLLERSDLTELLESIANSGYIDIEPLVVTLVDDKLIVLEGNRRLAAIKLLKNKALAEACNVKTPSMSKSIVETLDVVTVYPVGDRLEAQDFIGFKHINGPHRWDSIAKARYAANWYVNERSKTNGMTLKDIAKRMGDRHDTLLRMVSGIFVLDQAKDEGIFHVEDRYPGRLFAFSHLYTALTRSGFRKYLGLDDQWKKVDPEPNPIPKENIKKLDDIMTWLYGSDQDDLRPVISSQNPHLKMLGQILEKPKALAVLVATRDLKVAYTEVETVADQFEKSLVEAQIKSQNALGKINAYKGDDHALLEVANDLQGSAGIIYKTMETIRNKFLTLSDQNISGGK